jgi:hypothetical protein
MQPHILAKKLYESLSEHSILHIKVSHPTSIDGLDRVSLRNKIFLDKSPDNPVHGAGVYIIGSYTEVLRVGEAGMGNGSMGLRVYRHLEKGLWIDEARVAFFVPISPPEFRRLGEQTALAIHFQTERRLPKLNYDWR